MFLEKDYISFTYLCFYKRNIALFKLNDEDLAKMVFHATIMFMFQAILCKCLIGEILESDFRASELETATVGLYLAKFVTSTALHLSIFKDFDKARSMMKYIVNHPTKLQNTWICFLLAYTHINFSFVHEFINMIILFKCKTVLDAAVSFSTVGIIVQLNTLYYTTTVARDRDNILQNVFLDSNAPSFEEREKYNDASIDR